MNVGRRALIASGIASLAGRARAAGPRTMRIAYKDDIATLDPAIGYDQDNWALIRAVFDGLLGYRPGTTELELRLAAAHEMSEDGRVHRFRLRPGVRFHNGRALVAADVVHSLERTIRPATASPGAGFFSDVVGFDDVVAGRAPALAGVRATSDDIVEIALARPSAAFLHTLALNFAFVVPIEEVARRGGDWGRQPVGTGPFRLAEWQLGRRLVLVRNAHYFEAGVPGLDRLEVEIGSEPTTSVLRLLRGELDALGDNIPPSQFGRIMHDPATRPDVVIGNRLSTVFLAPRMRRAPFSDLRVRQAIDCAIDRAHLVRLTNGRHLPAAGILPPAMPGAAPVAAPTRFDPARAKALLARAGFANGFRTELVASTTDPYPRIAEALQQYLADIGIEVEIDTLADANVLALAGAPDGPGLVFSGGLAWAADFPDPSDFYTPVLSCAAARPGGWNWPFFCAPALDARARAADALADDHARLAAWHAIFADAATALPWIPLYNERQYTLRATRLRGPDAVFADPISSPINFPAVSVA